MADGRLGEAFIELSFGRNVFARCSSGASGGGHHADGVQAFYCEHRGLCFEQDVADLPAHVLVAGLGVTSTSFMGLRDGMASAFAVTGLAGDVALVIALLATASATALMVCTVAGAGGHVVLGAAVGTEDILRALDDQFSEGRRLGCADLDV